MYSETKYLNLIFGRLMEHYKRIHFLQNLTWIGILLASSLFFFVVLDHSYGLRDGNRIFFAAWFYGSFILALFFRLLRPLLARLNPAYTAKILEKNYPELEHRLIAFHETEKEDIRAKILSQQSLEIFSKVDLNNPYKKEHQKLLNATLIFSGVLIALFFYGFVSHKSVFTSLSRAIFPASSTTAPTRTHILNVHPGHCVLAKGETLKVSVSFEIAGNFFPKEAYLLYSENIQSPLQYKTPLLAKEGNSFEQEIGPLYHNMRYAVQIDDAHSETFSVTVLNRPLVESFSLTVTPPHYFQQSPYLLKAPYIVPQFSQITLKGTCSKILKAGYLVLGDHKLPLQLKRTLTDNEQFELPFSATQSTFFSFLLLDTDGLYNHPQIRYPLQVIEEEAPQVDFFQPDRDTLLLPEEEMLLHVRTTHSTGIHSLKIVLQKGKDIRTKEVWKRDTKDTLQKKLLFQEKVSVKTFQLLPGEHVIVHFEALSLNLDPPKIGKSEQRIFTSQVPPPAHHFFLDQLAQQLSPSEREKPESNTKQKNSSTSKNSKKTENTEKNNTTKELKNSQNQNSSAKENDEPSEKKSTQNNSELSEKEKEEQKQKENNPKNPNPKNPNPKNDKTTKKTKNSPASSQKNSPTEDNTSSSEEQSNTNGESQSSSSAGGGGGNASSQSQTQEALLTELSKQLLQGKVEEALLKKLGLTREEFQEQIKAFQNKNSHPEKDFEPLLNIEVESATSQNLTGKGTQRKINLNIDRVKVENVFDQFRGKIPPQYESLVQSYFQELITDSPENSDSLLDRKK